MKTPDINIIYLTIRLGKTLLWFIKKGIKRWCLYKVYELRIYIVYKESL